MVAGNSKSVYFKGFKGLHSGSDPLREPNELSVCDNWLLRNDGELTKRPGLVVKDSSMDTGISGRILGVQGNRIWYTNTDGDLYENEVDDAVTVRSSASTAITWGTPYIDSFYYGANDGIKKITAVSLTVSTVAALKTNTRLGTFHKQRLFIVPSGGVTVEYSDPNAFGTFASTSVIPIDSKTVDDHIVAILSFFDTLYILKTNSIWALYVQGDDDTQWILRQVRDNLGCINGPALVVENAFFFLGTTSLTDGATSYAAEVVLYKSDGTSFVPVTTPVAELYRGFIDTTDSHIALTLYRDHIIVPKTSNENDSFGTNYVFIFNHRTGAWGRWVFAKPGIIQGAAVVQGDLYIIGEDATVLKLYKMDREDGVSEYADDAVPYVSQIKTPNIMADNWSELERVEPSFALCSEQTWRVIVNSDEFSRLASPIAVKGLMKLPNFGYCRRFNLTISDNAVEEQSALYGLSWDVISGSKAWEGTDAEANTWGSYLVFDWDEVSGFRWGDM